VTDRTGVPGAVTVGPISCGGVSECLADGVGAAGGAALVARVGVVAGRARELAADGGIESR
jgi:hypothetical protein